MAFHYSMVWSLWNYLGVFNGVVVQCYNDDAVRGHTDTADLTLGCDTNKER